MPETVRLIAARSGWSSFLEQNDQSAALVIMARTGSSRLVESRLTAVRRIAL